MRRILTCAQQQRLGSLSLLRADDEEIELFAWAAFAAQADADSTKERVLLKARLNDQEAALSQLQQQMQEFVEAKTESEDVLVRKFAAILNAKKAKIRDLLGEQSRSKSAASQRESLHNPPYTSSHPRWSLLMGMNCIVLVEDEPKQTEPSKTKPSKSQPARRGRPSKRKIASKQSKSDSDDIFQPTTKAQELKDIKVEAKEDPLPSEDQLEASTPEKSDLDATEDEDDNLQARQLANSGIGLEGRPTETDTNRKALDVNAQQQEEPPPRRVLPFARKPSQVASLEAGDESTDDEL